MLKQRVLTAVVALGALLVVLFVLPLSPVRLRNGVVFYIY